MTFARRGLDYLHFRKALDPAAVAAGSRVASQTLIGFFRLIANLQ